MWMLRHHPMLQSLTADLTQASKGLLHLDSSTHCPAGPSHRLYRSPLTCATLLTTSPQLVPALPLPTSPYSAPPGSTASLSPAPSSLLSSLTLHTSAALQPRPAPPLTISTSSASTRSTRNLSLVIHIQHLTLVLKVELNSGKKHSEKQGALNISIPQESGHDDSRTATNLLTYLMHHRRTTCPSKDKSVFSILDHNGSDLTRVRT